MKTKIDIYEEEWCNMVFEGKNKEYGAYAIRTHDSQQRLTALFLSILLAGSVTIAPLVLKKTNQPVKVITEGSGIINLGTVNIDIPKPLEAKPSIPQAPSLPMVRLTAPVIVNNQLVDEDMISQELALASNALIGTENRAGDSDGEINAVPIVNIEPMPEPIHDRVDQNPEFMGGNKEMYNFFEKHLNYPSIAQENDISGKVFLQFVVNKEGEISDVKIMRGIGGGCEEEAARVLKLMPKWKPGKINGNPVACRFTIPVFFKMQ